MFTGVETIVPTMTKRVEWLILLKYSVYFGYKTVCSLAN